MDQSLIQSRLNDLFGSRRPSRWVTRERPKIDRIACPWLIRRFVDPEAEFLYVPTCEVFDVAKRTGAVAYDIPGAEFSHVGELCSFDAFLIRFGLDEPALMTLAPIVRGADTDRHELSPEAAGLHAISLGMAAIHDDDQVLLRHGILVYDALYAWAAKARGQRHDWNPQVISEEAR
jgi:hypothetical protein